jgi:hypothetical protein
MAIVIRFNGEQERVQLYAHALDTWRSAERLVSERWSAFLTAERGSKAGAFAAYALALGAEETAADKLASLQLPDAA